MNLRIIWSAVFMVFVLGTLLAMDAVDNEALTKAITQFNNISSRITANEIIMKSLKTDSRSSSWNFFSRNENERVIQRRAALVRETNRLYEDSAKLKSELLKMRAVIIRDASQSLKSGTDGQSLAFLDALAAEDALAYEFLDKASVDALKADLKRDFVLNRLNTQEQQLRRLQTLIKELKASKKALAEADMAGFEADYGKYIGLLGEKVVDADKSLELLRGLIN
ncbi:MAG TPA: hypothetical protein ENN43_01865 [bacterium]|nr:hypothetical protein [bacterium]